MSSPPITPEQLATLPPEFRALLETVIDHYEARIARLEARIAELEARLGKTPQNSSLPPSTQHPHAKPPQKKPKSKQRRGGQPGHARHERPLIPIDECDEVQSLKPTPVAVAGLLVGLESQVPQIYQRTTPPLVEKYGFTEEDIVFFRLHIVADTEHGKRGYEIVERLADSAEQQVACLRAVREATLLRRLYLDALYNEYVAPHLATSHA